MAKGEWSDETFAKLLENGFRYNLKEEGLEHASKCDVCLRDPIRGDRYKCLQCSSFDLCHLCFQRRATTGEHRLDHPIVHLRFPNELFGRKVSENDLTLKNLRSFYANDVHQSITCRGCQQTNFQGLRFKCDVCPDVSFCQKCLEKRLTVGDHQSTHPLILASDRVIMKIGWNDVELGKELGKGGFGTSRFSARETKRRFFVSSLQVPFTRRNGCREIGPSPVKW